MQERQGVDDLSGRPRVEMHPVEAEADTIPQTPHLREAFDWVALERFYVVDMFAAVTRIEIVNGVRVHSVLASVVNEEVKLDHIPVRTESYVLDESFHAAHAP